MCASCEDHVQTRHLSRSYVFKRFLLYMIICHGGETRGPGRVVKNHCVPRLVPIGTMYTTLDSYLRQIEL